MSLDLTWSENDVPPAEPVDKAPERGREVLSPYLRDMAGTGLLGSAEEISLARSLQTLERRYWLETLRRPPLLAIARRHASTVPAFAAALTNLDRSLARATRAQNQQRSLERVASKLALADADSEVRSPMVIDLVPKGLPALRGSKRLLELHQQMLAVRNRFVSANLGLVVTMARRYQGYGMALADLVQEGNLGLIKAVSRFDHRRGFRFSTYATWWIRHAIGRAVADKSRTVRVPVHVLEAKQKVNRVSRELQAKLGRWPTDDELSKSVQIPKERLQRLLAQSIDNPLSLDMAGREDDRQPLETFVAPGDEPSSIGEQLDQAALTVEIRQAMDKLRPIEVEVLRRRFGLGTDDEATLQEIAGCHGLSRERIRQIQEEALAKLRSSLAERPPRAKPRRQPANGNHPARPGAKRRPLLRRSG